MRSVETVCFRHFEELVVVAVIDVNTHDYRSCMIERFFEDWHNIIGSPNHPAGRSECFGVLDQIDRPEIDTRLTAVFDDFLRGNHVVGSVDPHQVAEGLSTASDLFSAASYFEAETPV